LALELAPWLAQVEARVEAHRVAPGAFRCRRGDGPGSADPYGCADALNLRYTLGLEPAPPTEREEAVATLHRFQEPATGLFRDATHHPLHTTAHCLAALELLDAPPPHRLAELEALDAPGALEVFLDGLDWRDDPWLASHRGAAVWAARVLAGEASADFSERYFAWLRAECDPDSGLWRRGRLARPYRWGPSRFPHLAGSFHYLFDFEHAGRAHPWPAALVDTCLAIRAEREWPFATSVGFAEIDWVYCLARGVEHSGGHRREEAQRALREFAQEYASFLLGLDLDRDPGARDLHRLFGSVCALAELQRALPALVGSDRPLRLVLDRRPFI